MFDEKSKTFETANHLPTWLLAGLAATFLAVAAAGCSGTDDGNSNDYGGSSSSETAYCCLNGAYHDCPDGDAAQACFEDGEPGSCSREISKDDECDSSSDNDNDDNNSSGSGGDIGDECQEDSDCKSDICIFRGSAQYGYCSKICDDSFDCPSFWDCDEIGNASRTYCVDD